MRILLLPFLCFTLLAAAVLPATAKAPAGPKQADLADLEAENRLLRAEYEIARQQKIYFHFDLTANKILVKASGIQVAELAIQGIRRWGPGPSSGAKIVEAKDALFAPERKRIEIPDKENTADAPVRPFELQALEVADMPTAFHARLDDGTRLSVRPAAEGFLAGLRETVLTACWYLTRPFISDWHFLRGKPYTEIRLSLPAADAQLLYWVLHEQAACLIDG